MKVPSYYRFLLVMLTIVSAFLFFWMALRFWYVLGAWSGLTLLCVGIVFFLGVWWYQRRAVLNVWSWLAWLGWSVIAGFACTDYARHFMDRAAFTRVSVTLVVISPNIAGFIPLIVLTAFLVCVRAFTPTQTMKK